MKKIALLVFIPVLTVAAVSCSKDETTPEDHSLAGVKVAAGEKGSPYTKLFVLSEGNMGTNNASVDFFRFSDGLYVRNAFAQMNPTQVMGLGDTGNDIKVDGDKVWAAINGSGIVEIFSAVDEKHIATVNVPSCRSIAFDDNYAYVSSYSGAYYGGPDRQGAIYKISKSGYAVVDSLRVGYQPEGVAVYGDYLYVANSGGLKSDYSYDNRLMAISLSSFSKSKETEIAVNLKDVVIDSKGNGYVSALGDYWSTHSGLYMFKASDMSYQGTISNVRVSCMTISGDAVYAIGTEDEWDYKKTDKLYCLFKVSLRDNGAEVHTEIRDLPSDVTVPYGICVNPDNGDIYVGDAGNYIDPGTVTCYSSDLTRKWQATAGVDPGHFALY